MPKVVLTAEALREFARLPKPIQARMIQMAGRLEKWPHISGAKPLAGELAGRFRLRTGDYRLQFHVSQDTIIVEKIGHRDGFYE